MKHKSDYVTNRYGKRLNFEAAVNLMDDTLREQVHDDFAPCTNQEFFDRYVEAYKMRFGEDSILVDPNPIW